MELLAPAGNLLKMKTALAHGADAVYLGLPDFSLRVRINDFDFESLKQAVEYCRKRKKKIYITVNIFAHNYHLEKLIDYLKRIKDLSPTALIVSDPGVLSLVQKYCPKIDIHLSTQANCTNYRAVEFWQKQGVKRIILGREVSLEEIKEIHKKCPKMELEYFVHGAMCMAYSGRCFLSKELVDRSANLGDCAQPCRWEYDVFLRAENHDQEFNLNFDKHGSYILNSKDLCLVKHLLDLKKAGVSSFKIEGRAKSVYYLANVVGIYKQALSSPDRVNFLYRELKNKITNRGYTTGFLLKKKAEQNKDNSHIIPNWEFCGQVLENKKKKKGSKYVNTLRIKVHNTIKKGDKVEIILPGYGIIRLKIKEMIDFASQEEVIKAHGGGGGQEIVLKVESSFRIPEFSVLRRKIN